MRELNLNTAPAPERRLAMKTHALFSIVTALFLSAGCDTDIDAAAAATSSARTDDTELTELTEWSNVDNVNADSEPFPEAPEGFRLAHMSSTELPPYFLEKLASEGALERLLSESYMGDCYERFDDGFTSVSCSEMWAYLLNRPAEERERELFQLVDVSAPIDHDGLTPRSCSPGMCIFANPYCPLTIGRWEYWVAPWGCTGYFSHTCCGF